jgi:hypothetical protein
MADPITPPAGTPAEPSGVAAPAAGTAAPPAENLVTNAAAAAAAAVKEANAGVPPATPPPVAEPPAATTPPVEPPPVEPPVVDPAAAPAVYKAEDFVFDLGKTPEGVDINTLDDGGALDRFREFCVENKYTPEKAADLIKYQQGELAAAQEQLVAAGTTHLKGLWGNNYETNSGKSMVALTVLDRKMGGRLAPAFNSSGLTKDPVVIEALYEIGLMIGEDNLGRVLPGGADPNKEVTTEESYEELFEKK